MYTATVAPRPVGLVTAPSLDVAVTVPVRRKSAPVSFRTSDEFKRLLAAVARDFGDNQTSAIENSVREYARRRNIKPLSAEEWEALRGKDGAPPPSTTAALDADK